MATTTVAAYLAAQDPPARRVLQAMRRAIKAALPRAEEVIAYGMPTYRRDGKAIIYIGGWKAHVAVYPAYPDMIAKFRRELAGAKITKGAIKFSLATPVPALLVGRLATYLATRQR